MEKNKLTITEEMNLSRTLVDAGIKKCGHGFQVMGTCLECGEEVE